jgi:hypothetical protein
MASLPNGLSCPTILMALEKIKPFLKSQVSSLTTKFPMSIPVLKAIGLHFILSI